MSEKIFHKGEWKDISRVTPPATTSALGLVQVGDGLNVTEDGVLSAEKTSGVLYYSTEPESLPTDVPNGTLAIINDSSEAPSYAGILQSIQDVDDGAVHKTGDEEIAGNKTFTGVPKIQGTAPSVTLMQTDVTRGVNPSADQNVFMTSVRDKDGKFLGSLYNCITTSGEVHTGIYAYKYSSDGANNNASIRVHIKSDGTTSTYAPSPDVNSNGNHIATTNWVRQAFPDWLSNNPSTSINADDQAAIHNGIYRGKNLTNVYTLEQLSAKLQAGDFTDLYIGDYITKPFTYGGTTVNVNWRFGHFNYWKYMGDTATTQNHILMVPDKHLFTSQMNTTNTTAGGVPASIVWGLLQNDVHTAVNSTACMNGHVLTHRDYIPDSVNTTAVSGAGAAFVGSTVSTATMWRDIRLGMFKEPMVYSATVFGSSGYDVGCGKSQIALFRLDPTWINCRNTRVAWWLGAVTSSTLFAYTGGRGDALYANASNALGVRPYFLFA